MDCNLYEFYKNKKNLLNVDKIRSIGYDILEALNYMHAREIFHRDIKPENILVLGDRIFKVADLGSCKSILSKNIRSALFMASYWIHFYKMVQSALVLNDGRILLIKNGCLEYGMCPVWTVHSISFVSRKKLSWPDFYDIQCAWDTGIKATL